MTAAADDWAAWLRLRLLPRVSRADARRLLGAYGSASALFQGSPATWRALLGREATAAVAAEPPDWREQVERTDRWLAEGPARRIVTLGDAEYPRALLDTADPPLLLYAEGRIELAQRHSLAIVGSRNATPQGEDNARAFARDLARQGLVIVSGLARGIDAAAHEGAMAANGDTIAVLGTGLSGPFTADQRLLAPRVAAAGLLLSEYPLGMPGLKQNFLERNRLIAGLSRGTLVVEAALRSGSLSTARMAGEAGREVMAVPGSIHSPLSKGCHALIRQGARLVESSADVLEEIGRLAATPATPAVAPRRDEEPGAAEPDPLLRALGHDPVTLDALQARTGEPTPWLQARLLELELAGQVARLPGGLFQRRSAA